jgi:hypothetical protein
MKKTYDKEIKSIANFTKQVEKLKVLAFYIILYQTFNMNNLEATTKSDTSFDNFEYSRKLLLDKSESYFLPALEEIINYFENKSNMEYIDFIQFSSYYLEIVDQLFRQASEKYTVPFSGYSAQQFIEPIENSLLIGEIDKLKTEFKLKAQLFIFIKNYLESIVARTSAFNSNSLIIGEVTSLLSSEIVGNLRKILEQCITKEKAIDYDQLLSLLENLSSRVIMEYTNKDNNMIYNFLPNELSGVVDFRNETDKKLYEIFLSHSIALDPGKEILQDEAKQAYGEFSDDKIYAFINNISRFSGPNFPNNKALKKYVEERTSRKLI